MKISIATDGKMVSGHFGHCEGFTIITAENGKSIKQEFIKNPGHQPGFLPNFLNDMGVNVIISGGMGGSAIQIFNEKGIDVITGASGDVAQIAELYLNGKLISSDSVCSEHQHADSCGNH